MPSRSDLYAALRKLLLQAGIRTVFRGYAEPTDFMGKASFAGVDFPVAGVFENKQEVIEPNANYGYHLRGHFLVWLWLNTGAVSGPLGDSVWGQMDDVHDAVLRALAGYYGGEQQGGVLSQTTVFNASSFGDFYWFPDVSFLGGAMQVTYEMNFA